MISHAGGVDRLATMLGISRQNLHFTFTALRNLPGPSRVLAEGFARERGIPMRLYVHPKIKGFFLVSAGGGWWAIERGKTWESRVPSTRAEWEDWGHLHQLELPFTSLHLIAPRA
jgi:hypothetical protein